MSIELGTTLRALRQQKGIGQEVIASACGVSVQAVSKWECGDCYPDITLLPTLADYFSVSIDTLLRGKPAAVSSSWPDDDVLRVVQYRGRRLLDQQHYNRSLYLPLRWSDPSGSVPPPSKIEI